MLKSVLLFYPLGANDKLSGQGLDTDNLCMIKIYVNAEIFENRLVTLDPLLRFVIFLIKFYF